MSHPAFFSQVPAIVMHDSLAALLGAADDGLFIYTYLDAVRLAGHSCPTVARAYLMTRRALQLLYPDAIPERGMIAVSFSAAQEEGVTGVIASVASLITGAAGIGGFKGIGGRFRRNGLLDFGCDIAGEARFVRTDTGAAVSLAMQMQRVSADPRGGALLPTILSGQASAEQAMQFAQLWQERVKRILIEHADDVDVIRVIA